MLQSVARGTSVRAWVAAVSAGLTAAVVVAGLAVDGASAGAPAPAAKPADPKADPKTDTKPADPMADPKSDPKAESVDAKAMEAHDKVRQALRDLVGGVKTMEEFQDRWKSQGGAFSKSVLDFLKEHPKYRVGNEAMLDLAVRLSTRLQLDPLAVEMLRQIRDNQVTADLSRKADEAISDINERAGARKLYGTVIEFDFVPLGKTETLKAKDLRGKVVVLYFWAAWCDLCAPATDELKALYAKYNPAGKDKAVEIIGVSLDDDQAKVEASVKAAGVTWPQQYDGRLWNNTLARRFAVDSIPRIMVLDKEGKLVQLERRAELDEVVRKLLGGAAPEAKPADPAKKG